PPSMPQHLPRPRSAETVAPTHCFWAEYRPGPTVEQRSRRAPAWTRGGTHDGTGARGQLLVDGSVADRLRPLLPGRCHLTRSAPALLRRRVPDRRGRLHVLRAALGAQQPALGRPHFARL